MVGGGCEGRGGGGEGWDGVRPGERGRGRMRDGSGGRRVAFGAHPS